MNTKTKRRAKGSGSLSYNSETQLYTLRKQVGYTPKGKQKILVVTGSTEASCIKKMCIKEREWFSQKVDSPNIVNSETVNELCSRHLHNQIENQLLANKSIDRRESTINNQIAAYPLGNKYVTSVRPRDIEDHISKLLSTSLSASSIVKTLDVINAAFDWALSRQEIDTNPCASVKRTLKKNISIRAQKDADDMDVNVLNEIEYERFVAECSLVDTDNRYLHIGAPHLLLLLFTGMRAGEMLALRRRDYNPSTGLLTIYKSTSMAKNRTKESSEENNYTMHLKETKNNKARVIQLSDDAKKVLSDLLNMYEDQSINDPIIPHDAVYIPNTANKLEYRAKQIYKLLDFPSEISGLHILRRTFATRLYNSGIRVSDIAAYIGDLESTTQKYYIAKRKKEIINGENAIYVPLPTKK